MDAWVRSGTAVGWMAVKFCSNIHGPERISPHPQRFAIIGRFTFRPWKGYEEASNED